ncbi:cell division protein FtsA [Cerasicoccus arenae]|uniref:Cell division protein FtsA n=1 Tax=Cerasicoccus arenae TaxID=424488 RepID=A0A8J3GFF6_9BACT|nr:cell division protein FtsA [Cerasicoccus arenae]MBK1856849.1 cell division protein FtsA [Cerasicoccus arenae]GHC11261.1 cell division protein FtsA [Cerasicoccus arenae]
MSQSRIIGAVDIGAASVTVLVGDIVNGRSLNIIGKQDATSEGVKKGEIVDFKAVSNSTHAAIMGAEKSAGTQIEAIFLSQTGSHLEGLYNSASVNVSASDNRVSDADMNRVMSEAKNKKLAEDRLYIHHIRNHFLLDGRPTREPLGMQGEKLEVGYWSVLGDERKVRDHIHVINGFGLNVEDIIVSSIASGTVIATDEEKRAGVMVIDLGAGATDWVIYQNGVAARTGVLPVGSDHINNDIALGLRVNRKYAEKLKLSFGKAVLEAEDKQEKVWMVGDQMIGDRRIPKQALVQVIRERVEEIFELVKKQAGELCSAKYLPAGVLLTGGGSQLDQIDVAAEKSLGVPARRGELPSWVHDNLQRPEYCTALGLLHFALSGQTLDDTAQQRRQRGLLRRVTQLFGT